jgi:hypothetical protein
MDFIVEDHGSVVIFRPMTETAEAAVEQMELDGWQMWGDGFAVDHRSAHTLVELLMSDGITCDIQ